MLTRWRVEALPILRRSKSLIFLSHSAPNVAEDQGLEAMFIQEHDTKIAVPQTMAKSSSRDTPTTITTVRALPKTRAI
jgi:hypothetical protein